MTISLDKKYRTRDGRDVRVLCVDAPLETGPVVVVLSDSRQPSPFIRIYQSDGSYKPDRILDLVEVRPTAEEVVRGASLDFCGDADYAQMIAGHIIIKLREAGLLNEGGCDE